ncbi:MAG: sugar transferase [Longimicrobiales bacterium]
MRLSARLARILSTAMAVVGIIVTAPIMVVIAIVIKLTSPGPVFYVQDRVGVDRRNGRPPPPESRRLADKGGRIFTIYKFRTMHVGADGIGEVWASPNDDRVTPVGRFLRSSRLDELPQLFNVLLGDMNIVGPRPEQPEIFQNLRGKIDRYPERQKVLPGITGLAQVSQAPDQTLEDVQDKIEYDLAYIERKGPIHDLWIMVKTLPVVIKRIGW